MNVKEKHKSFKRLFNLKNKDSWKKKTNQKSLVQQKINRRQLIAGTASLGAIALTPKNVLSQEANPDNLPPNLPEWTQYLGDGVDVNPYGVPSEFETSD